MTLSRGAVAGQPLLTHFDVFATGAEGYHTYRIPALVTAPDGALLVFAEGRKESHHDPGRGDIDLVLKRSTDNGKTWSTPVPGQQVTPLSASIERFTSKAAGVDRNRIVWAGPKGPGRKQLVVWVSYDEGQTFINERVIDGGLAAYSDLSILEDKTVGVIWERGVSENYPFVTFTRLNRELLESP